MSKPVKTTAVPGAAQQERNSQSAVAVPAVPSAPGGAGRRPRRAQRPSVAVTESLATPRVLRGQDETEAGQRAAGSDPLYQRYLREKPPHWG